MKKIILIFIVCIFLCGCAKQEKNTTVNTYENYDKDVIQEIIKTETREEGTPTKKIEKNTSESSKTEKVESSVKSMVEKTKDWYSENRDELKDISNDILKENKEDLTNMVDSAKEWYIENKEDLVKTQNELYYEEKEAKVSLKETATNFLNKLKNNE